MKSQSIPLPRSRELQVCVVGAGSIGGVVADVLRRDGIPGATLSAVLRSRSSEDEVLAALETSDVFVEATSVEAARDVIPRVVKAGKDVIVCSCGVFAEERAARLLGDGPGRVLLPTGALGGFDILAAATRAGAGEARLRHTTVKSPSALDVDEPLTAAREVFRGSAREAALVFPRTSNSSVALALATLGLDRVEAVVVADPDATSTRHILQWESPLGNYEMMFENTIGVDSPGRTSAVTAWSVTEALFALTHGIGSGAVVLDPTRGTLSF